MIEAGEVHLPQLRAVDIVGEVVVDLIVIDPADRFATAVVVGGRSSEVGQPPSRSRARLLRAAELTMVDHLKTQGWQIEIGILAVIVVGESSGYPEDLLVRTAEIDDLFDVPVAARLVDRLRRAAAANSQIHRPRFVGSDVAMSARRSPTQHARWNARTAVGSSGGTCEPHPPVDLRQIKQENQQ
jgi:hypothetical protein